MAVIRNRNSFENLLPRFSHYESIIAKEGRKYNDLFVSEIKDICDQSKWEDRLLMFALIMTRSVLEEDPRPGFHKWFKKEIGFLTREFEEQKKWKDKSFERIISSSEERWGHKIEEPNRTQFIKSLSDWDNLPPFSKQREGMLGLLGVYQKVYPSSLVKTTPIGEFCYEQSGLLSKKDEVREYINNLILSLCSTVEQLYSQTVELKKETNQVWLHKGDIDWDNLIFLRWKVSLLVDWYKDHCLNDIHYGDLVSLSVKEQPFSNTASYIIDCVLKKIVIAYEVSVRDYSRPHYRNCFDWFGPDFCVPLQEALEDEIEDQFEKLDKLWVETFGEI